MSSRKSLKQTYGRNPANREEAYTIITKSSVPIALCVTAASFTQYLTLVPTIIAFIFLFIVAVLFINLQRATFRYEQHVLKHVRIKKPNKHCGCFTWFSTPKAILPDVLLLLSSVTFLVLLILRVYDIWAHAVLRGVFTYSFLNHCFLNGNVYHKMGLYENRGGSQ